MSEKKRLGRGLGALIPEAASGIEKEITEIPISKIKPNPYQPRIRFDDAKLRELADSIKEHGIVQAVVVTPDDGGYILVAGERRFRAARMVGLESMPALVKHFSPSAMLEIALIENLQREDLNPVEEAEAYRRLMVEFNLTQEELSRRVGKSRSAIANTVRLLSLPQEIKEALVRGDLTAGQARPLLGLPDNDLQIKTALQIMAKGMTARDVENLVSRLGKSTAPLSGRELAGIDPHLKEIEEMLQRRLGTKVKLSQGKIGGSLEVFYYGDEDLERLISLLLPEGIS